MAVIIVKEFHLFFDSVVDPDIVPINPNWPIDRKALI